MLQAANSFDRMGSKGKVADVSNVFGAADTMSVGDIFSRKQRKTSHKSANPLKDTGSKRAKVSSTEDPMPARPASTPTTSPDASLSQLQGKS